MARPFKCDYCEDRPTTTHGIEFLCNRHYNVLYAKKSDLSRPYIDVHKTEKEKVLYEKYMKVLENFNFVDKQKTKRIVRQFLNEIKEVQVANHIYH